MLDKDVSTRSYQICESWVARNQDKLCCEEVLHGQRGRQTEEWKEIGNRKREISLKSRTHVTGNTPTGTSKHDQMGSMPGFSLQTGP